MWEGTDCGVRSRGGEMKGRELRGEGSQKVRGLMGEGNDMRKGLKS